eukprot:461378-Amphidinium_carterae.1
MFSLLSQKQYNRSSRIICEGAQIIKEKSSAAPFVANKNSACISDGFRLSTEAESCDTSRTLLTFTPSLPCRQMQSECAGDPPHSTLL